jgi:hypothetical protein
MQATIGFRVRIAAFSLLLAACGDSGSIGGDVRVPGGSDGAGDPGATSGADGGTGSDPGGPGDGSGDPAEGGLGLWSQLCSGCHGDFAPGSTLSSGNANGDFRLDVGAAIERHGDGLEAYIDMAMPMGAPDQCTGACAETLGAYLRSLQPPAGASCSDDAGPAVGTRQVLLLSSREYQNALEDLLGVPMDFGKGVENHDGRRGGFVDMTGQLVSSTLLDRYSRNAEAVAEWAVANGRPFECTDAKVCADRFVGEFLFRAFRGPVSDDQKDAYRTLFQDYPDAGLELALKAALTSPHFLYRVEVGVDVEQAQAAGYYDPTAAPADTGSSAPPPSGDATEICTPDQFAPESNGYLNGDAWMLDQNGRIALTFDAPFTDPSTLEVLARGTNHDDVWPEMIVRVNGAEIGRELVDNTDALPFRFEVTGVQGTAQVEIAFENDSGVDPYGPGQDANLLVEEVRLTTAAPSGSEPDPEPAPEPAGTDAVASGLLDDAAADTGAFVLTPFELASTLAFRLTGAPPDPQLLEAARQGRLATRSDIRTQVERLIDSPRGHEQMGRFVTRWFRLDEIDQVSRPEVPELTAEVKAAMLEEVKAHFLHVFYDESVPYSEFFGGDYTFLNATLAEFYGIEGQFDDSFRKTTVEGRGGPLASGAFMTVNAHADRTAPILRAVRSRQTALCHYIDPPNSPIAGDDIDEQRAAAQERVTEREQAAGVLSSREFYFLYTDGIDACAGCHERIINPMFGMEDFDHVGRLRPSAGPGSVVETVHGMDVEVPLEATLYGVASTSDPETIEYAGAKDLSNQLADTPAINECLARRAFRFLTDATYVDRDLDAEHQEMLTAEQRNAYNCVATRMLEAFEDGGQSPRAMFIELATDSMLLFRR